MALPFLGPFVEARIGASIIREIATALPREGDGAHDAAFALGGIMAGSEWDTPACVEFIEACFSVAGVEREDIGRCARASVEGARAGRPAYGWTRLLELCPAPGLRDLLKKSVPGLTRGLILRYAPLA